MKWFWFENVSKDIDDKLLHSLKNENVDVDQE